MSIMKKCKVKKKPATFVYQLVSLMSTFLIECGTLSMIVYRNLLLTKYPTYQIEEILNL